MVLSDGNQCSSPFWWYASLWMVQLIIHLSGSSVRGSFIISKKLIQLCTVTIQILALPLYH